MGGTGYTGIELLRILSTHADIEIAVISSRSEAGNSVAQLFQNLPHLKGLYFSEPSVEAFSECDVVFLATPNGIAMTMARALLDRGIKVIDLAADFRLKNAETWAYWYGQEHADASLLEEAVYGLAEIFRGDIASARLIANPGCYPTATILGLFPLIKNNLVDPSRIIVDAKSGVTGAGRGANVATLFSEVSDSFKAYSASGHRHHPEITEVLQTLNSNDRAIELTFVPHLVPMLRGIHSTIYVEPTSTDACIELVWESFNDAYTDEPFVEVLPLGSHPETRTVRGSNKCRIAVHQTVGSNRIAVLSVIDNLNKGAAGQAVQNMNLMFGLDEQTGLDLPAVMP